MNPVPPPPPRRPGRPQRPDNAAVRGQLLDLATDLFAARGVAATTISHIAQQAGVTPAMVHYYFKSRDQLIDAVVLERIVPVIGFVWSSVPLAEGAARIPAPDPAAAARAFIADIVGRLVQCAAQRPWLPSLWLHEVVNEGGQLRERVLRHLPSDRLHAFAGLIADSQRQGAITPGVEPRLVFLSILGLTLLPLATSSLWRRVLQGDAQAQSIDTQTIAAHAIAMLTGGLFSPSAPSGR
ncbi:TetR family transcriptional regulator [Achromobacter sp. RTa]|uniref:TetR/AcrR family transcriptional regulator n=1 Tax=Achromobacter sp. RTa TaxID=1532557 RepID=UPI00050DFD60|nr:TetR/AcrR family transcriptional regulator [Achromobacter sp. RTa]KGD88237.1 TetR family transcriptional regulator [Achromobacter sp. RTa]